MPDRDPLTGVPPSRHPFQFWVLCACVLGGAASAFDFGRPNSLDEFLPHYIVLVWGWTLMIGGLIGLAAAWWPDRITGLLLERIALWGIGGITAVYGAVLLKVLGHTASVSAFFCISIAMASFWRIRHVNRELKVLSRWIDRNF